MQEYWSGLLCPPPRNSPNPGIEPTSVFSVLEANSLPTEPRTKSPEIVHPRPFPYLSLVPALVLPSSATDRPCPQGQSPGLSGP